MKNDYKALFPYLYRYRVRYFWGFIFLIMVDAAQVIIPFFLQKSIDAIYYSSVTGWTSLLPLVGGMVLMMTVISCGRFLWRYFIHGSARRIEAEMRDDFFAHILTLSYDFFQKNKIGDLMARATNDMNTIRTAIGMGFVAIFDGTVMAVSILVIIFVQDARTAALAVLPLPLVTVLILLFGNLVGKRFQKAQETYSSMSNIVQETFAGVRVVKSFVKEWYFLRQFADTNDDYRKANMDLVKLYGVFFPLISFFSGLTSIILLVVGGIRVVNGLMTPGELTALFRYLQMLIWPLMGAGFMVNMVQRGAVSLRRINEVMSAKPLIASSGGKAHEAPKDSPIIQVKSLTFAYDEKAPALKDISFTLEQGEILGILGKTGSGKTTLIKALTRMVEPPRGAVLVDGIDAREWDLAEFRGFFSVVPQDSYLFSDSIKSNVAYGVDGTDEQALQKAVIMASIDRDLADFAQGWDTVIGEKGLTISGGQKQRVAIARAVAKLAYTHSRIMVLDDSLSAVDAETEKRILANLFENLRGTTAIIISHRVSTLSRADKVIVLEGGAIVEYGPPELLAAGNGFYAKINSLQQAQPVVV
ncbi:MAG: ABC transporter ATP-binding protein/permease [Treponema sp.]|jgi:ATP-binding cassette subfamily B protein|nr:ABC transporter ATP-binding protein/permease [Treponema sp.]